MKCEICHRLEAAAVIKRTVNGKCKELFVCNECAHAEQIAERAKSSASAHSEKVNGTAKNGGMMLGLLLGEAFTVLGHAIHDQQLPPVNPSCPACGITRNEIRARASFGCSECYKAFGREIKHWISMDQYSVQHVGKSPAKYQFAAERRRLELQLRDAIYAQRFEEAAILRDKLAALPDLKKRDGEKPA